MCKRFVLEAYSSFLRISAHSMVVCTNMKTISFSRLTSKNLHLGIQSSDNPISKKSFNGRKGNRFLACLYPSRGEIAGVSS